MPNRSHRSTSRRAFAACFVAFGIALAGCTVPSSEAKLVEVTQELATVTVTVRVVDETGTPLTAASLEVGSISHAAERDGTILFAVDQPVLGMVTAPDHITMPIVLTPEMKQDQTVRLLSRLAADGTPRVVLHFAGDTMMGRRYQEPIRDDTPVVGVDDAAAARAVVSDIAPLFAAADISSLNLESVVGMLPQHDAYPGKRFLLQSPPSIIAALDELGTDVATLGNNHLNDWQGPGLTSTRSYLDEAGIIAPGAGLTEREARQFGTLNVFGQTFAYLSYTTVTGDFVNDSLPRGYETRPATVADDDAWQWESLPFGYGTGADKASLPIGTYRAGEVWEWFRDAEPTLADAGAAWAAAVEVYPELQDWVARRNHGGAAWFRSAAVEDDVAAARAAGADVVVVQLHGGFQFADAPSEFLTAAARTSIDAGADIVVGHHPHVLQGFEWYRGRLISYSLGNFVFDQNFLSTFSSVVLRTVFEGDQLVEARAFPVTLDNYRPTPMAGEAAARLIRMLDVRSSGDWQSARLPNRTIGAIPTEGGFDDVEIAAVVGEHGSGRITVEGNPRAVTFATGGDGIVDLTATTTLQAEIRPSTWFGVDLFGYGSFEDVLADGEATGGVHWSIDQDGANVRIAREPSVEQGNYHAVLATRDSFTKDVVVRPVARITPKNHRFVDALGDGLDGRPEYSVRLSVRRTGAADPFIRIDAYHFFDSNPTEDPESKLLSQMEIAIDVPADGGWHRVDVPIPAAALAQVDGKDANAAMFYVGVSPPTEGETEVAVDDISFIEWRAVAQLPPGTWHEVDAIRTTGPAENVTFMAR